MSKDQNKEKVQMDPKYIIKLTVTLLVTCVIVAGALGAVNKVTAPKILEINQAKTVEAMKKVVADPEGSEFSEPLELTSDMTEAALSAGGTLTEAYEVTVGGEKAGYTLKVVSSGSQGNIEMMVGVDADKTVTGVSIVSHKETSGIGTKVMENQNGVLDQFAGKTGDDMPLTVGANVNAISGATVSSKGVTAGVNAALAAAGVMA